MLRLLTAAAVVAPLMAGAASHAQAVAGDDPLPRLAGIVVSGGHRIAIFTEPDGRGSLAIREGERAGSFTVTAIRPGEADMTGPGGRRTVRPSSDPQLRAFWLSQAPIVPLIEPGYREAFTESDQ